MSVLSIILYVVLCLVSLVLIVSVLMQQGQRQGLGAIAGGAETFLGKNKSKGMDAKLKKYTKIAAVVFIVLSIAATIVVSHDDNASGASTDPATAVQEIVDAASSAAASASESAAPAAEAAAADVSAEATAEASVEATTAEPSASAAQ